MRRGELFRRAGLAGAFALLLIVCVAAPVFAQPVLAPTEEDPIAREEALESPQAVAERESSEYAYVNLTPAEEEALLREHFAPQLQAIDADPARALADVVINRIDSPTEALVTVEGEKVLLESEVPLRAPEEDGDLHKVELELEETAAGYEPANPLVDLSLPDSADEPIRVGEEGLAITPVGTADAAASPLGEEDLFLPAAHEDTSLLLSPIAGGLELSALLASRNSPQQLAFKVTLPAGASLRAEETGGAAVVREGDVLAVAGAPHAVDAQGTEVPVALSVEGDILTLSLAHREMDVAYPLFIDPTIEENWGNFSDASKLSYWKWSWSGVGSEDFIGKTSCIVISACWGNGLYVRARANFSYPAGSWARWWFSPQGSTTYIRRAVLGPIHFEPRSCWESEPHAYTGIWNDNGYWEVLGNAYPGGYMTGVDVGELKPGTRTIFVGFHAGAQSTLACGRDYHFGGATLFLDDPEKPTVGAISGQPTGWIKDGAKFTINAPVSDPGLGVKKGFLYPKQSVTQKSELPCDGHYSNPCPANHTFQFSVGADSFDEGEKSVEFSAEDILGKPSNTHKWTMKVDRTPPEIDLAGQLAIATDETGSDGEDDKNQALKLPVYNLTINTTDGNDPAKGAIEPAEKRSGVKGIAVFLDQKQTPEAVWENSSCPDGNCPLSKTFTLKLNELSAGTQHTLHVIAQDFAGNDPRVRHIEFEYIPATGIKDEYVMQYFPLPDGSGNEGEEEHPRRPELAVNLVNGNLVYRQKDVEVETASADLEVELYYNSLLPESQNTEWGDGWTMGEAPSLEIEDPEGSGPPTEATIVEESGAVESRVDLPTAVGEESFDKRIQATVAKEPGGGYTVTDETGETGDSLVFSSSGRLDEVENGTAATVDYGYEEGAVAEIAIEDPGTADVAPGSLDEDEVYPDLAISHSADFGTLGTAAGQFNAPADVATDAHGNVFVVDRNNHRVQKLGPGGQFLSQFGGYGSADGQLANPGAIALDAEGNVWVTDTGNDRVQKFSPAGQFLAKFGSGGFGAGKFLGPKGIAVGKDGSIWVADHRLQRFTASGQFIERVGAEQIVSPKSLDADADGNVFVADPELDRILVFDKEGDYLRQFGSSGTGPGQLQAPVEVDADADGGVWVADEQADRVQLFNAAGDYIAGFGSQGSGAQQFKFEFPSGIASDGKGRVWIADAGNNRVGRWLASPITEFVHSADFGTLGAAAGQFNAPADVAADAHGNVFVVDRNNHRVQKLGPGGQFLSQFGGYGSADGQLANPGAIALDAEGNVWVTDTGNDRVQKFSPAGQFLAKFGSGGFGAGKFLGPKGIAVGKDGSIWVADHRLQRFTASGQFIERVGAEQIISPKSLDADADGNVFVADPELDRILVFDKEGDYLRQFGSSGTGPGQLQAPVEVDADADGGVWVADEQADRVQLFNAAGDYIAGFGSQGSGAQQFKFEFPSGIASDGKGRVWIADAGNNRVAEWAGGNYEPSNDPVLTEDDPQLAVEVSEGLVESVEGDEAGTVSYDHSGDLLTSVEGPDTDADFTYDGAGRMTQVTLANGTYAEIEYADSYGRVKSVAVAPEGANKKVTLFNYSDEPRRTTVVPPSGPIATYDFAADGSVFKWWNASQPPILDYVAGTLHDNRETSEPIAVGEHTLNTQAHSDEGIASIQIIADNNQLVDEKTCEFNPEEPNSCVTVKNEWVTETGNWPPGIVHLEVIATDRLGNSTSERFWVNIPYTPPPDPEAEEAPRFSDILSFREEFGLDLDLKGDEFAINDRIFDLIGAWHNPMTPEGEVARATNAKWGIPLRVVDVVELEYRQRYIQNAASVIPAWANSNAPEDYAGYYVDHRAGGTIHVGFTQNQSSRVADLEQSTEFGASGRLAPFPFTPSHAYQDLVLTQSQIASQRSNLPELSTVTIKIDRNLVEAGTTGSVQAMEVALDEALGVSAPIEVIYDANPPVANDREDRDRFGGRVRGGDRIRSNRIFPGWCTAGFGAWLKGQPLRGKELDKHFLLTAGHCGVMNDFFWRRKVLPSGVKDQDLGRVKRNGILNFPQVDGLAILLDGDADAWAPRQIYLTPDATQPVAEPVVPTPGMIVCASGVTTDRIEQGAVEGPPVEFGYSNPPLEGNPKVGPTWEVPVDMHAWGGDSGAPVWRCDTGNAIGLWNAGRRPSYVTPLLPMETGSYWESIKGPLAPGILAKLGFSPHNLSIAR